MTTQRRKVIVYLTRGTRLLVFRHLDAPEAGLQVPAGTIEPGESPQAAALRESREETGLYSLKIAAELGMTNREMQPWGKDEIHERHFFHLVCEEDAPERWVTFENNPSDDSPAPIRLECSWVDLSAGLPGQSTGLPGQSAGLPDRAPGCPDKARGCPS